jgi:hypothetical protein
MRERGRIRLIKLITRMVRAGEMNFAPTKMVHVFEDERVEGSGRNEFRPYKHSAYLYRPEKS